MVRRCKRRFEQDTPAIELLDISPIYHVDGIGAVMSIYHGAAECFSYEDQPHTFNGASDQLFMEQAAAFFAANLN